MATHAHTHSRAGCSSDVSGARSSPYPMIDVPTALSHVLSAVHPLPAVQRSVLSPDVLGAVLSADVVSAMAFPPFAASVMDGYAVVCPCPAGVYPVTQRCTAGSRSTTPLLPGQAAYITTGSALPPGADGVIMVEMTEAMEGAAEQVRLLEDVPIGQHVRAVGSDIAEGQRLCAAGAAVSAAEVGLLVSQCIAAVSVHRRPVIGVLSSGDELVDPSTGTAPPPGCIVDSNRVMLRALLTQHTSAEVVDLGIARDSLSALDGLLMPSVVGSLDALVTTGGVSMGELDLIKAFLARSARVLFGRLSMKPGKPTTFALLPRGDAPPLPVFALPGNPVSAFVCCQLLVLPAVRRMEGRAVDVSDHGYARCGVRSVGTLRRNADRLEYHRAMVYWDRKRGELIALSTGLQTSSRLLSVARCNALLIVDKGADAVEDGALVDALLTGPVEPIAGSALSQLVMAARHSTPSSHQHHHHHHHHDHRHHQGERDGVAMSRATLPSSPSSSPSEVRVAVITVSDRCHAGKAEDRSGPAIVQLLTDPQLVPPHVAFRVVYTAVVPDEAAPLADLFRQLADQPTSPPQLVLTTGGTGFSPRDITPDALAPLLPRPAPGLVHLLLSSSLRSSPLGAMTLLSRPVAGIRGRTLCITLPGSVSGVKENLMALLPVLPHALQLMEGVDSPHAPALPVAFATTS